MPFVPYVVKPLSVSIQSSRKKRLILDVCHVNRCIWKQKFKCEDWRVLPSYINKTNDICSFDLKAGYYYIDIFLNHQVIFWFFLDFLRYCSVFLLSSTSAWS